MDHIRLISESFETAAHSLSVSLAEFHQRNTMNEDVAAFIRATDDFRITVNKFVTAAGMVAENQHRMNCGKGVAYDESDFAKL